MNLDELYVLNRWWRDKEAIKTDRNIVQYEKSTFKYFPKKLFEQIPSDSSGIYTLRGPRQIGKTTFLKLYIKSLLSKGTSPSKIFFLTCDGLKDRLELIEIIEAYFKLYGKTEEMSYIFIDEITVIEDWQVSIKYLSDLGRLDNCLLILTGSSAYDLKTSSEKLPGRKGEGKDLVFLPITFNEFLENVDIDVEKIPLMNLLKLNQEELKILRLKYAYLTEYFTKYLTTGGFPRVISDFLEYGTISETTKNIYLDFVLGDAQKYLGARKNVLELLRKLPDIFGQRFSWNSLVDIFSSSIRSEETIQKYFEYFGYSFILANVFYVDLSKKTVAMKKQKKTYPVDRVIADVVSQLSGKPIDVSKVVEMMVLRHLIQEKDVLDGLNLYNGPFYWYSDKGNEIDFVAKVEEVLVPIEVKYQNRISKSDYTTIKRVFGKGLVVTKDAVFKDENILGIPVWLFLAVVGLYHN